MPQRRSSLVSPNGQSPGKPNKILPKNINRVILGDLEFETWYHSPYPDSLIFTSTNGTLNGINGFHLNGTTKGAPHSTSASWKSAICPVLHVCPYCFAYSPSVEPYTAHLKHHRSRQKELDEWCPVPESAEKVYDWAGYAVYKIDGEKEKLYCQHLSLFGKLFLEQKSVFFDTAGFWYHVLTYAPSVDAQATNSIPRKKAHAGRADELGLSHQVLGFFSKEKISWDQNNLACILVFPPFQHRQLGKLLMSVSYKLSGWEWMGEEGCAIGGPEKPLSVMGKKSYLRFWSERVARYIMGQSGDSDGNRLFQTTNEKAKVAKKTTRLEKEVFTVKDIGERTGMLAEDVIAALTEMKIWEVRLVKRQIVKQSTEANGTDHAETSVEVTETAMKVRRSRIVEWAIEHAVELEDPVKEEGFIGEWATFGADESEHEEV